MLKDLEGKLRADISALRVAVKNEIAKVDQQVSTVEVRVGIVEELVKDRPTNKQVTEQLKSLENKLNSKIAACTLKSDSADAIS